MPRSKTPRRARGAGGKVAEGYTHPDKTLPMRPEVGTQAQFRKRKPPVTYRYDSSLSPSLEYDGQNSSREVGEAAIRHVQDGTRELAKAVEALKTSLGKSLAAETENSLKAALTRVRGGADALQRLSRPFLNWAGKAERLSFEVPTLPLFIHERLSTKAIVETLVAHKTDKQSDFWELLGDPRHSFADQVLKAYEYQDGWVNRLILGDSLVVMSSLLHYERLGGQVQMVYIDPPCGVKFGSNFQPFVRKRDVSHGDDEDLTREPEMVKAYRDTWELGLHSYLTYMRDRLLLARELLTPSGSVFVQISDENLHHVRELMDEVFGENNFVSLVTFQKTTGQTSGLLPVVSDYLLWYARDRGRARFRQLFTAKEVGGEGTGEYVWLRLSDGSERTLANDERRDPSLIPRGARVFRHDSMVSQGFRQHTTVNYAFEGKEHHPGPTNNWKTTVDGLDRLAAANRLVSSGRILKYKALHRRLSSVSARQYLE